MERVILATLRWDTAAVTPQDFLPHFLASMGERGDGHSGDSEEGLLSTLRRHSDTLAAMCACDSRFLGATPSLVAAASLNCALRGLGTRGPVQLAVMSEALAKLCQADLVSTPVKSAHLSDLITFRVRIFAGMRVARIISFKQTDSEYLCFEGPALFYSLCIYDKNHVFSYMSCIPGSAGVLQ